MCSQPTEANSDIESQKGSWVGQLDCLFSHYEDMSSLLKRASQLAVEFLNIEHCTITWLAEDRAAVEIRAGFRHNGKNGISIDKQKKDADEENSAQEESQGKNCSFAIKQPAKENLALPLYVKGEIVGYLCVAKRKQESGLRPASLDQELLFALSRFLGHAIEMQQMRQLLASRYASVALGRNPPQSTAEQDGFSNNFIEAVKYPNKVAKIIAKSFYKDLRKAGFEPKQILVVTSEIIENLNETFRKTKVKTDESGS